MLAEAKREAERIVKEARERQDAADLRGGGHQAGRARRRGHHRGRPRPGARDPARRRGLRRRDPQHARGQPLEVHRGRPARARAPAGQGRAGRSRALSGAAPRAPASADGRTRAAPPRARRTPPRPAPARAAARSAPNSTACATASCGPSKTASTVRRRSCAPSRPRRSRRLPARAVAEEHALHAASTITRRRTSPKVYRAAAAALVLRGREERVELREVAAHRARHRVEDRPRLRRCRSRVRQLRLDAAHVLHRPAGALDLGAQRPASSPSSSPRAISTRARASP